MLPTLFYLKEENKLSKIRGKKLTRQQYNILNANGIKDVENWLYIKTYTTKPNGDKSPAKNSDKLTYMVFQNRDNGETVKIEL